MIVITGTIRIPVERLEEARPALRALIEETRREDGCLAYSFGEDVLEPGLMVAAEAWRDGAALAAHLDTAHFAAWRELGADLGVSDVKLTVYEVASANPL